MKHPLAKYLEQIPPEDWEKTPASVKKMVELMMQGIEKLEQQSAELQEAHQQLLERINKTSKNSSSPPSSDPPGFGQKSTKKKSGKKRGGQPGHEGKSHSPFGLKFKVSPMPSARLRRTETLREQNSKFVLKSFAPGNPDAHASSHNGGNPRKRLA